MKKAISTSNPKITVATAVAFVSSVMLGAVASHANVFMFDASAAAAFYHK